MQKALLFSLFTLAASLVRIYASTGEFVAQESPRKPNTKSIDNENVAFAMRDFTGLGIRPDLPRSSNANEDDNLKRPPTNQDTYLIRMLWIRHGLSCANVLDECHDDAAIVNSTLDASFRRKIDRLLRANSAGLQVDWDWGMKPRGWLDARGELSSDCALKLKGLEPLLSDGVNGRLEGALGHDGDVIRLHDLYQDPALTSCSLHQSQRAGLALQQLLQSREWALDAVASSTLLRAAQTAIHMFGRGSGAVLQLPYIDERAPAAMTALQLDNSPGSARQQRRRLKGYGRVDSGLVTPTLLRRAFPRGAHDFERFKAFAAMHFLPRLLKEPGAAAQLGAIASAFAAAPDIAFAPRTSVPQNGDESVLEINRKKTKTRYRQGPEIAASEVAALETVGAFTRVVTIAVVGHGAMIRKHCLGEAVAAQLNCTASSKCGSEGRVEPNVKANNNAVYEKLLTVSVTRAEDTSVLLREAAGDCPLVMDAPTRAVSMAQTSARDLATCDEPFDVKPFLHLTENNGTDAPFSTSSCEAAADDADAFPMALEVTLD
jgi:broad specificity phosphatase PhoE